jgi:septum site-determining protein MinD
MARVIAVASAKGGVGKTTTAAGLAAALATTDARVVAVDADLGMPNLAAAFGVDVDGDADGTASDGEGGGDGEGAPADPTSVHDVLAGRGPASAAVASGAAGVDVLGGATALSAYREADPAGLDDAIADLAEAYDYVILDTGAGLSHDTLVPLGSADEVVLVTTPERDAVGDAARTREVADRIGAAVSGVVLTRVREADHPTDGITDRLSLPVLGTVPEDDAVRSAAEAGVPVVAHAPHSPVAAAYRRLAASIVDVDVPDPDAESGAESTPDSEPPAGADATVVSRSDASAGGSEASAATGPGPAPETEAATSGGETVGTAAETDSDPVAGASTDAADAASTDAAGRSAADATAEDPFDDGAAPDDVLGEDAPGDLLGGDGPGEGDDGTDLAGGAGQSTGEPGPSLGGTDASDDHGPDDGDDGGRLDVESDDGPGVTPDAGASAATGEAGTDFDDLGRVGEDPAETEPEEDGAATPTSAGDRDARGDDQTGPDGTVERADDADGSDTDVDDDGDGDGDEDSRGGFLSRLFG